MVEPDRLAEILRVIADRESLPVISDLFPDLDRELLNQHLALLAEQLSPISPKTGSREVYGSTPGRVVLKTDGGSRGNPGPSGAGWVVFALDGSVLATGNEFLGRRTNNEAEYAAVLLGLQAVLELGYESVDLRVDSELLVKQVKGIYRVKNERLKPLHGEAKRLLRSFASYSIEHIRREANSDADRQANLAMDRKKKR